MIIPPTTSGFAQGGYAGGGGGLCGAQLASQERQASPYTLRVKEHLRLSGVELLGDFLLQNTDVKVRGWSYLGQGVPPVSPLATPSELGHPYARLLNGAGQFLNAIVNQFALDYVGCLLVDTLQEGHQFVPVCTT